MKKAIILGIDAAVPTLLESYVEKGYLPNIRKLVAAGSYTKANAVFPGITPVNWATIATGAYQGTHGITDFLIHHPGDPLDESRNAFRSNEYLAETLWEAAEKEGFKVATINFPGTWPSKLTSGYCLAGEGAPSTGSEFEIRSSSCFATVNLLSKLRDATPVQNNDKGEEITRQIILKPFKDPEGIGPQYKLILRKNQGRPECSFINESSNVVVGACELNQWTNWLEDKFIVKGKTLTGTFRFKLTSCSEDLSEFSIYCSQVMPKEAISQPGEIGIELVNGIGPFIENSGSRGYERKWIDLETYLEEGEYKANWLGRAGKYLIEKKGVDVLFLKYHFLDHCQHLFWGKIDSISPWYVEEEAAGYEKAMIRAYTAVDKIVGEFLPLIEKDYHIVMVSDHGHIPHLKSVSINNLLWKNELIAWEPTSNGKPLIHWDKTFAFGGPCVGQIMINLKGRDPNGIVPQDEYEQLQEKIIDILLAYYDPETGLRPVVMAIKKEQAASYGMWGDRVGDVIYYMRKGYTGDFNWSPLSEDGQILYKLSPDMESEADYGQYKFVASKFQSAHGCGYPDEILGRGTEQAVFIIAGQDIKKGYQSEKSAGLVDVAPTLCYFSSLPRPKNAEGNILMHFKDQD